MKILGLEFSSNERSVALGESTLGGVKLIRTDSDGGSRQVTGMALVDRALQAARVEPAQIDVLAVGLGPGSYAGIRSAIALAQGWQLARNVRLLGVSSVAVLAKEAQTRGIHGDVTILIDAQRSEFYQARFVISEGAISGGELTIVQTPAGDRIVRPGELLPSAATLIHLASQRHDYLPGEKLEPIYLRETAFVKAAPARFSSQ